MTTNSKLEDYREAYKNYINVDDKGFDPLSATDFYSKAIVAKYVLDVSVPTMGKWESEGVIFEPFHVKSSNVNARRYYTLADLMRLSIIRYGSIHMDKIYDAILVLHYGFDGQDALNTDRSMLFARKTALSSSLHSLISRSFNIIKFQITNNITEPIDLSPYLKHEPIQENLNI